MLWAGYSAVTQRMSISIAFLRADLCWSRHYITVGLLSRVASTNMNGIHNQNIATSLRRGSATTGIQTNVSSLRRGSATLTPRCASPALGIKNSKDDVTEYRKVLVLYTGGTIGMIRNEQGALAPVPNAFERMLRKNPLMHDTKYAKDMFGAACDLAPLVLPNVDGLERVVYTVTEYDPILDSSNMTMDDWSIIASDILHSYEFFDGFVVLHGTDTLSYTASALSFMLENLGKSVIITGAQIPIFEVRSDGTDNFVSALLIAGNYVIPEVTIFFNYKLLRGNRTTKISTESFDAFDSLNAPPLAVAGINIEVDYRSIFRPCSLEKFNVHVDLNQNVGLLRVFPSIQTNVVETFLNPPIEGVVLQTFGAGNMPSNRPDLLAVLQEANDRGVIIVNCTQCSRGTVANIYETGKSLYDSGVLPGYDMTPEAALTKLAYVLSIEGLDITARKNLMCSNLRGELTSHKAPKVLQDYDLVDAVARTLNLSSPKEVKQLNAILFPAMLGNAVETGDTDKLAQLKGYGADVTAVNADKRTPLHIASSIGNISVVKFLLLNGASVHMKDRYEQTPFLDAIKSDHLDVIKLLKRCGAHLTLSPIQIGAQLCSAANYGNLKRLQSYQAAGANLNQTDVNGRTALHLAALHNYEDIVKFLLRANVNTSLKDMLGFTAYEMAEKMGHTNILELFNSPSPV